MAELEIAVAMSVSKVIRQGFSYFYSSAGHNPSPRDLTGADLSGAVKAGRLSPQVASERPTVGAVVFCR